MIELHPEEKMPLYEQLYNALAQDIRSGALQPGKALPGRRTMAAQLGISTNTVDTAYQMLAAEGLAVTRPRSGFFVQETGGMLHTRPQHSVVPAPKATPKNTVSNQDDILYDLSTGSIDTSLFPARSWGRIQKELMYQRPELLQRGDMQGDENLRAQIAAYLGEYRGVDCTADQVVVGAGVEYLKTTASPAYRWKLTKAVCRSARWSKAEPTCAMLPPATTFPPALPCRPPGARSC